LARARREDRAGRLLPRGGRRDARQFVRELDRMARHRLHGPHDLDVAQEVAALARDEVVGTREGAGERLLGDRLDQEIDGVEPNGGDRVVDRRAPRHEDELRRRVGTAAREARSEGEAVEPRHAQVEEDDADVR